jgi:hypothetical protein
MLPLVRHPDEVAEGIRRLLELLLSLDVTLYSIVIDWLQPVYGWSMSKSIVQSAMRFCPLDFSIYNGKPCLAYLVKKNEISDVDKSENSESDFISVPYTSFDEENKGFTAATIIEGDLVKLRCRSAIIWVVYEIHPHHQKIILAVHKRETFDDSKFKTGNIIVEKRTFHASAFMGAIIWREKLVALEYSTDDCEDQSAAYDEPSILDQSALEIRTSITECHIFQVR